MTRSSFQTTHWSLIQAAGDSRSPEQDKALDTLCRQYWKPVYAFIRRGGKGPADAQDLTQGFFALLLEKNYLRQVQRERGRFRSCLLAAVKHYMANEQRRHTARKRGGVWIVASASSVSSPS